jgi:hypothetical protein
MISAAEGNQAGAGYGMQLSIGAARFAPSFGAGAMQEETV